MFAINRCDPRTSIPDQVLAFSAFANLAAPITPRTLSYNPAKHAVVITISSDNGLY